MKGDSQGLNQETPPGTIRLVRDPCGFLMAKADPTEPGVLRGMTPDQLHLRFDVYLYETRMRKKKPVFPAKQTIAQSML